MRKTDLQILDQLWREFGFDISGVPTVTKRSVSPMFIPSIENGTHVLRANIAGTSEEELEINVEGLYLRIKVKDRQYTYDLKDFDIDLEAITSSYTHGILEIRLPEVKHKSMPIKIEVNSK